MDFCLASSVAKGLRRTLYNPSVSHIVPVLRSFMNDLFNQEDAVPHNYVCRKCLRSLESYVKIKKCEN